MAFGKLIFFLSTTIAAFAVYFNFYAPKAIQSYDDYLTEHFWKPKKPNYVPSEKIENFRINVDQSVIQDLYERLNRTRFFDKDIVSNFQYGFNDETLKKVVNHWLTKYNWKEEEKKLNQFKQFKTEIEGLSIHFIHQKPVTKPDQKVYPILLVHGWPGSVWEFYKLIPFLQDKQQKVVFEVIVPSLPGFGFSDAPLVPGLNSAHTARIFVKLMERLGHKKFFYHGGDWGSLIGNLMAKLYPKRLLGVHLTMLPMQPTSLVSVVKLLTAKVFPNLIYDEPEIESKIFDNPLEIIMNSLQESGYLHLQATKPDTLGSALTDSPAGLAAYILEKFSTWVNLNYINKADGGLEEKFTLDELLTNIMIYWVSNSITSSMRYYKESIPLAFQHPISSAPFPDEVPVGLSVFPNEITFGISPKFHAKRVAKNLIQYEFESRGGHFAAFEEPKLIDGALRRLAEKCLAKAPVN